MLSLIPKSKPTVLPVGTLLTEFFGIQTETLMYMPDALLIILASAMSHSGKDMNCSSP